MQSNDPHVEERRRHIQGTGAEPHFPDPNDRQVGGSHYGGVPLQHWDIVAMHDLDYFQGQITKYVMRHKKKHGIEDLKKAQHFLEKYIDVLEKAEKDAGPKTTVFGLTPEAPMLLHEGDPIPPGVRYVHVAMDMAKHPLTVIGSDDPIDGSHRL